MPAVFDLANLFDSETTAQTFGSAASPYHTVGLTMERRPQIDIEQHTPSTQHATCDSVQEISSCAVVPQEREEDTMDATSCLCGCDVNDLDMIQCDCCKKWQHTVCAGFYSNRDNRITTVNYVCFACRYANNKSVLKVMKELTAYRRALSVVFNEGISEEKLLGSRLGYSGRSTKRQIQKMMEDRFITKQPGKGSIYTVIKTKEVRDHLRLYFNYELISFPKLHASNESMTQPKVYKAKCKTPECLRTSVTELTLSVNDAMEC